MRSSASTTLLVTCLGLVLISALFTVTMAAECNPPKVPVTMLNPAGKVLELCMPDSALPGLRHGATASGGRLLEAQCPCFSQQSLDDASPVTVTTYSPNNGVFEGGSAIGGSGERFHATWCANDWLEPGEPSPGACVTYTWCESATGRKSPYDNNLTEQEALACTALLGSLVAN